MRQYPGPTGPTLRRSLSTQDSQGLDARSPSNANKGKNAWIYHLPRDIASVETSPWLEAIDARDIEMSFGQLLHEPNIYL